MVVSAAMKPREWDTCAALIVQMCGVGVQLLDECGGSVVLRCWSRQLGEGGGWRCC